MKTSLSAPLERLFGLDLPDGARVLPLPGGCETLPGSTATKGHTERLESAGGTTLSLLWEHLSVLGCSRVVTYHCWSDRAAAGRNLGEKCVRGAWVWVVLGVFPVMFFDLVVKPLKKKI